MTDNNFYLMWGGSADTARIAVQRYTEKYGQPPEILLVPKQTDLKPMEGMNLVVRTDQYVPAGVILLGNVPQEMKTDESD